MTKEFSFIQKEQELDSLYNTMIRLELTSLDKGMWFELVSNGIINPDAIKLQINKFKEKKVRECHKYNIADLYDGRVGTWAPDATKPRGRRNIKAATYEKLIDKLYMFYFLGKINTHVSRNRFCDIFEEWLAYKCKKKNNTDETMKQNRASYQKYVQGTEIDKMPLKQIKTLDLENWAIDVLINNPMTAKSFNTHKIVVTGTLRYAKRKGLIPEDPWKKEELEYTHLFKSARRKPSADMIFYPDEIEGLIEEFDRGYELNGNIANLGLKGNFELGLRIGELCALKWSDINWQNETVFIQRMEDSSGEVVDYVKSDAETGYRELNLSDELIDIFKKIRRSSNILSEYIFLKEDGSRADKMVFVHRLEKAEITLGWKESGNMKRSHCIRRTVASRMNANGWALDEIRRWLGHTMTSTTLTYIYNPFRESETQKKVKEMSILHTNKHYVQADQDFEKRSGHDSIKSIFKNVD
ncbi:tyrosine-type recombinase/integrase [Clostridium sp. HBUAS56010]|uniref:tyrosine-type recombinase/integrase n=1 Tax=Clostridium sp. HBUAS56010 TaxID=2571127 RepID=UPI001FAA0087|nr:tyrosine-type recombinase/integrase [Clostridium sp. HBUAS56010]